MFGVAGTYLMIYGPRDEEELETMRTILENSVKFMTGVDNLGEPFGVNILPSVP